MKHIISLILLSAPLFTWAQIIQLSGQVYWPNGVIMEYPMTLHVEVDGCPSHTFDLEFTGGAYSLNLVVNPLLCDPDSVRLSLSGEAKARDAVSTLDLVKLVKYLLGIEEFVTSLQLIAGDANNSHSISALDLVEVRKLILGYYQDWPNGRTLNFFVKDSASPPPLNIFPVSVKALPAVGGNYVIDWWGVKTADFGQF